MRVALRTTVALTLLMLLLLSRSAFANPDQMATKSWTVNYTDGGQIVVGENPQINFNVTIAKEVWDLEIRIDGSGMDFSNSQGGGQVVTFDHLNAGDTRVGTYFTIKFKSATVGEQFNVTLSASSYSTPPGLAGARVPGSTPDDHSSKSFLIKIVAQPSSGTQPVDAIPFPVVIAVVGVSVATILIYNRRHSNRPLTR